MNLILTALAVTISWLTLSAGFSLAGHEAAQNREGTRERFSHLGDDGGIHADPHRNRATVAKPGAERPMDIRPPGEPEKGNCSSFGAPLPPNNLTPAPVLPFNPNRALSPPPSPQSPSPPSGTSRFGRS